MKYLKKYLSLKFSDMSLSYVYVLTFCTISLKCPIDFYNKCTD